MTPERRAEIEAMLAGHDNHYRRRYPAYGGWIESKEEREERAQAEALHSDAIDIIRELLAEVDRLSKKDQEYTQYKMAMIRQIGAEYILEEGEPTKPPSQ